MIIDRELSAQVTSCTSTKQLYNIITSSQDNSFILRLAAQSPHIDLKCAIFLSAYLNDLVLNPKLALIEKNSPDQVRKIFRMEVNQIPTLEIKEDSPWWNYLLKHPSDKVRQAVARNQKFPKKLRDTTALDVPSKIGLALNRSVSAEHCKNLEKDPEARVSTLAKSALLRFMEDETLVNDRASAPQSSAIVKLPTEPAKKDQEFHPMVLIVSILTILILGMGLTIFSPGKSGKEVVSSSPRGGVIANPQAVHTVDSNYVAAVDLANKATLMAASAKSKSEWNSIVVIWDKAIDKLKIIDKQDADYEKAQSKILKYQVIRDLHANNGANAKK